MADAVLYSGFSNGVHVQSFMSTFLYWLSQAIWRMRIERS